MPPLLRSPLPALDTPVAAPFGGRPLGSPKGGRAQDVPGAQGLRVGYLTNVYPGVSHSFIRREILALQRAGVMVERFSIRPPKGPLPDPDDRAEQARTTVLLDAGAGTILGATLAMLASRPVLFLKALGTALSMGARAGGAGPVRHLAYLAEACLLVRLARARNLRHIHVHFGTNPAAVARLAWRLGGPGYSMTVHGPDEFDAPRALSLPEKIADAAFTVAISHHGRGQLMRWSDRAAWPRIAVVRCGLDRGFLEAAPADHVPKAATPVFLCVARLDPQKGLSLLIEAAARLAADHDFELRIIGDGAMRAELSRRITELGLGRRIALPGWRSAAAIREELEGALALILPSFAEGLPVVLMEALALGRPVIATAVAGVPELVDAECGWLVPSGSEQALAEAMRCALAADAADLAAMGAEGRRRVRAMHDADANARTLARLLAPHG